MNYMVMFVLEEASKLDDVLEALCAVGISGVTIIESTGLHRKRRKRAHIPMRFNFEQLGPDLERGNHTLFMLVPDEDLVQRCVEAIETVIGDFNAPNTGVLCVWPVPLVRGLPKDGAHQITCAQEGDS